MADVTLNSAVRSNLRTLQSTTTLMNQTEERLSTGKKVNSALDNPSSFFTAQALDRRASDLNGLLDSVSNSVKALEAADNGIKAITDVVEGLKSTARSALQSPSAIETKSAMSTVSASGSVLATDLTDAAAGTGNENALDGLTLTFNNERTGAATTTAITLGAGTGEINTLKDLNAAIEQYGVQGKIDDGELVIETLNSNANQTIVGTGTAAAGELVIAGTAAGTASDLEYTKEAQDKRAAFVADYNDALEQISSLAKDASYNGVNLLNGDDLDIAFNEDGTSKLDVKGVSFDANGIGLGEIEDADFFDADSINGVIDTIDAAFSTLEAQSSKFGSQLQIVQTRETFTKDMVGTLEDGALALTGADTNEEAANLATLQTRQSLIVSALSISTSQESNVLQLLR
jgi:flagellin